MGFWNAKPCRLENGYRRVEGTMIPRNIGIYRLAWLNIPDDFYILQTYGYASYEH
jgi:hypothetical protein